MFSQDIKQAGCELSGELQRRGGEWQRMEEVNKTGRAVDCHHWTVSGQIFKHRCQLQMNVNTLSSWPNLNRIQLAAVLCCFPAFYPPNVAHHILNMHNFTGRKQTNKEHKRCRLIVKLVKHSGTSKYQLLARRFNK